MYASIADITAAMNADVDTIIEAMRRGNLPVSPAEITWVECLGMNQMGVFVYEFCWEMDNGDKGRDRMFCKLQHDLFSKKLELIAMF